MMEDENFQNSLQKNWCPVDTLKITAFVCLLIINMSVCYFQDHHSSFWLNLVNFVGRVIVLYLAILWVFWLRLNSPHCAISNTKILNTNKPARPSNSAYSVTSISLPGSFHLEFQSFSSHFSESGSEKSS